MGGDRSQFFAELDAGVSGVESSGSATRELVN
jgi:hypothetical protein